MGKVLSYLLAFGAGCALMFFLRGCGTKQLETDLASQTKKADSVALIQKQAEKRADSIYIVFQTRSYKDSLKIDSLTRKQIDFKLLLSSQKGKIADLLSDLQEAWDAPDSVGLKILDSLKDKLGDASTTIDFLMKTGDEKDSILINLNALKDSVIQVQHETILTMQDDFKAQQEVIKKLEGDLQKAIDKLKAGNKVGWIRTAGEAVLLLLLLTKK